MYRTGAAAAEPVGGQSRCAVHRGARLDAPLLCKAKSCCAERNRTQRNNYFGFGSSLLTLPIQSADSSLRTSKAIVGEPLLACYSVPPVLGQPSCPGDFIIPHVAAKATFGTAEMTEQIIASAVNTEILYIYEEILDLLDVDPRFVFARHRAFLHLPRRLHHQHNVTSFTLVLPSSHQCFGTIVHVRKIV